MDPLEHYQPVEGYAVIELDSQGYQSENGITAKGLEKSTVIVDGTILKVANKTSALFFGTEYIASKDYKEQQRIKVMQFDTIELDKAKRLFLVKTENIKMYIPCQEK